MRKGTPSRSIPVESLLPPRLVVPIGVGIIVMTTLTSAGLSNPMLVALWASIHLGTLVLAGIPAVGLKWFLIKRQIEKVTLSTVVLTGVLTGLAKALLTAATEGALGLSDNWTDNLTLRVIGASIAGVWVLTFTAYADRGLRRLDHARRKLIQRNVATRLRTDHQTFASVLEEPLTRLSTLSERAKDSDTLDTADIRHVVDETIRPLSKALWSTEDARYPAITVRSLLRASLVEGNLRAGWIALLWSTTSFTALAIPFGVVASAAHIASIGVWAYLVWAIVARILPKNFVGSLVTIVAVSIAIVSLGSFTAATVLPDLGLTLPVANIVIGSTWMTLVVTGVSVFFGAREISDVIRRDLASHDTKALVDKRTIDTLAELSSREIAMQLHGEVQSKLLGIAAGLDHQTLSQHEALEALQQVITTLRDPDKIGAASPTVNGAMAARDMLDGLVGAWKGIVDVSFVGGSRESLEKFLADVPDAIEVVREGLTNAHRHGKAKRVAIQLENQATSGILTLEDDGYGPREGSRGLGFNLIDRLSSGRWTLSPGRERGSVLRIEMERSN